MVSEIRSEDANLIVHAYNLGKLSLKEITKIYRISPKRITNLLKEYEKQGYFIKWRDKVKNRDDALVILAAYNAGFTNKAISATYDISGTSITNLLEDLEKQGRVVKWKGVGNSKRVIRDDALDILIDYNAGLTNKAISATYGISGTSITNLLKDLEKKGRAVKWKGKGKQPDSRKRIVRDDALDEEQEDDNSTILDIMRRQKND